MHQPHYVFYIKHVVSRSYCMVSALLIVYCVAVQTFLFFCYGVTLSTVCCGIFYNYGVSSDVLRPTRGYFISAVTACWSSARFYELLLGMHARNIFCWFDIIVCCLSKICNDLVWIVLLSSWYNFYTELPCSSLLTFWISSFFWLPRSLEICELQFNRLYYSIQLPKYALDQRWTQERLVSDGAQCL